MAIDQSFQPAYRNRKVKLLCSFGGKFIHRPTDWTLRYVGGHSRIIAVPRDTTLPQLCRKLSHVFGAPVAIRYQLPKQEIDNLVSVYSVEDLEYMMEEFDKLAQPSAKLRVFLFTQSEIASFLVPSELTLIDLCDGGREYIEAVNATFSASHAAAIYSCQIRSPKKDSVVSIQASSSAVVSPVAEASDSFDRSIFSSSGTATFVEDQFGRSFAHPLSHPNHKKAFHLPLSQIPPLQPWLLPPPTIEPYGLRTLPPDNNHMDCNLGSISEDTQASYGLLQQNVLFADGGDHIQVLHPSGTVGLSSISYNVLEPLRHPQGYVKQAEGINDDLTVVSTFYILRSTDQLNYIVIGREGLFMAEQGDMMECWESYSTWVSSTIVEEFIRDEGVLLAMIFGHGMEPEDENSRRMQKEIFIKILSYVEINISSYELILLEVLSQAKDSST